MNNLYRKVLDHAGYDESEATKQNVIDAFLDYVDTGAFSELSYDEAKDLIEDGLITVEQICYNMLKI